MVCRTSHHFTRAGGASNEQSCPNSGFLVACAPWNDTWFFGKICVQGSSANSSLLDSQWLAAVAAYWRLGAAGDSQTNEEDDHQD
jgi:hypothetical protein